MTTPTTPTSFLSKLEARVSAVGSLLCVGLDPHEDDLFPGSSSGGARTDEARCDAAFTFCKTLIDLTLPYTACYKPNAAFFEALGDGGLEVLQRICRHIHDATTRSRMANANAKNTTTEHDDDAFVPAVQVPTVPILLDVKRGDIGTTAHAYAVACYDYIGADAVTLSPLMGYDSIRPFVSGKYSHKAAFLLCKTSNPGSQELMACKLSASSSSSSSDETLYERIAMLTGTEWAKQCADESSSTGGTGSCSGSGAMLGLVVGATDPMAMAQVRQAAGPNVWILAPGVGAQGGDLIEACRAGLNAQGTGMLIPVSRGISRAQDPAQAAQDLQQQIQKVVQEVIQEASTTTKHDTGDQQQQIATNSCNEVIQPHQREFLEYSLSQSVLKFGSFVLKSGRTSPYFFNAGLFATGAALFRVGKAYASTIMESSPTLVDGAKQVQFDVIFGPAYKGIPLAAVVSSALYSEFGIDVGYAYNRKETKSHGEGGNLVGAAMEGKRVLIVDDVITAGTAIRESHSMLQKIKANPVAVIIALDRAEKRSLDDPISAVQAVARDLSLPVVSIVNLPQLQSFLEKSPAYGNEHLEHVIAYRKKYGV